MNGWRKVVAYALGQDLFLMETGVKRKEPLGEP